MKQDFLLHSDTAKRLYEKAKTLPVLDFHNHLSVKDIWENKRFSDVYELWIHPDPYKHRAMRMCGVPERYITGNAPAREKFIKWWETLPRLLGNPLYHWSVMELSSVFEMDRLPDGKGGDALFDACNRYLAENEITVASLMKKFRVEKACPCASILDEVAPFRLDPVFSPSLRGDDMADPTAEFITRLNGIADDAVQDLASFKKVICARLDEFYRCGCRFADHALDDGFCFLEDDGQNDARFVRLLQNNASLEDRKRLSCHLLTFLGGEYAKRGFVMQLHLGALRRTSTRLREIAGPAGGFAGIGNSVDARSLARFLDTLDTSREGLPKTVLFPLNPGDNAMISTLSGSFSADGRSGLVTQGPAWWWCDQKKGIADMLENTASFSVLSNFIGMTTDSRSFLSFVRHDYFRRILCDWVGKMEERGELFCSEQALEELIKKLCYENAKACIGE